MVTPPRVTYEDMWWDAAERAGAADDLLREFQRLEDQLDPVHPDHVARAAKAKAVATAQANLIAFCERNKELVKKRLAEEAAEQAAREARAAAETAEQSTEAA